MKLTNLSCTQFAGIRDRSIDLTDGVNVIFGRNESGKSTLVNLLSRTLFQDHKIDGRRDKEFQNLYYPVARRGSRVSGDFADGKLTLETADGSYTLTKEWGYSSRCLLSTPDGVIRDQAKVNEILKGILGYGEGVYTDMLLTPQRNSGAALQTLLDASKKSDAKQEVVNAVSQAFAESDGIPTDAIEQAIQKKITAIAGKHWDERRNAPEFRRANTRWSNDLGSILKAYYDWKDAQDAQKQIGELESAADQVAADYLEKGKIAAAAAEAYESFQTFAGRLTVQNERRKAIERLEKDLMAYREALENWPVLAENVRRARMLEDESENRTQVDLYEHAKRQHDVLNRKKAEAMSAKCPEKQEIADAKTAQREIQALSNLLCGMNLTAALRMLNGHTAEIRALRTGDLLPISECMDIREAVSITVPGVMEMTLTPANVDAADVERQIAENKAIADAILRKYGVFNVEELEALADEAQKRSIEVDAASEKLARLLGNTDFETLEAAVNRIALQPRSEETILEEIKTLCGKTELSRFLIQNETQLDAVSHKYGSMDDLRAHISDARAELDKAKASVASVEDIPAKYRLISDPEAHLEELSRAMKEAAKTRETALTKKTDKQRDLENALNAQNDDPSEAEERCSREFEEQKELLARWRHIERVFLAQKEAVKVNPTQDIAENFARYLDLISGGKVTSEFPDTDRLNPEVYSGDRKLDYDKLSEGTKETVSLAFRLAVLDHLFPEGGGLAVLDDPFANMDAERTEQAAKIIKDCAKRHQVIFLTCREEYVPLLGGNLIQI